MITRLILPDSHGVFIDPKAAAAVVKDIKKIQPDEIIGLGDHIDVAGIYSAHPPGYVKDLEYSLEADYEAAEKFWDEVQKAAPKATGAVFEGNHEQHVERWIARTFPNARDATAQLSILSPAKRLRYKERGFKYIRMSERYGGLSVPGVIKLGKCYFVHGITAAKHAAAVHVERFGANVVFGHCHRASSYIARTIAADAIGGWCPGTLAQLQPLYQHTTPSNWTHGYAIQVISGNGRFIHINVPIVNGWSGLDLLSW